ncbi:hypothetical protein [Alloprevotella rava]|uniref:DUF4302 domain-containing protein n=1 Tax=Alloprevotella rava TaxID=671218 RepID=A0A7W5UKR6_9BACT|nr:hypothetical protein [Alloprevotella rava]MBB3703303.1 hypothetical protein [Alloprevotella rava]
MKQYIKTLALMLLVGLGLTSCLNDDRFDEGVQKYQKSLPYGVWKSVSNSPGNYDYTGILTKDVAGKDLFYVIRTARPTAPDSGEVKILMVSHDVQYSDSTGMLQASAPSCYFGDGENGTKKLTAAANLAILHSSNNLIFQMVTSDGTTQFHLQAARVEAKPTSIAGMWEGYSSDSTKYFTAELKPADAQGNGTGVAVFNDNDVEEVAYTFANNAATVTGKITQKKAEFAYNDNYQLVATLDGATFVVDPMASTSEPENFTPAYTGKFTSKLFGESSDVVIYKGDKGTGNYLFTPFIMNSTTGFVFNWANDNTLSFDAKKGNATGYTHKQNGRTLGPVYALDAYALGESKTQSSFANNVFTFYCFYSIPGVGDFGVFKETLQITGSAAPAQVAKFNLKLRSSKPFGFNGTLQRNVQLFAK